MSKFKKHFLPLESKSTYLGFILIMVLILCVSIVISIILGSVDIELKDIAGFLANKFSGRRVVEVTWDKSIESIVWDIRFPRVFVAFFVGAGLTLCGIIMQALTKNTLADPYVLGISQGASAGAVFMIMYGSLFFYGPYGTMLGAFIGAVISIIIALNISKIRNKITATQLILAGIAVAALFGAATNLMIYMQRTGSDKVKTAQYWMMGSLSGSTWERLLYVSITFLLCFIVIYSIRKMLDAMLLGDDVAMTLGVNTSKLKIIMILVATLLTGVIVSISGVIGFVGLTIPHITRSIVGSKHTRLIPAATLVGGTFLVVADVISRVVISPEELPIGVVSAFFGAPLFLYLIKKSNNGGRG